MYFCPVIRFYSNSFILKHYVKHGSFSDAFRIYRHMTDAMNSLFEVRRLLSMVWYGIVEFNIPLDTV